MSSRLFKNSFSVILQGAAFVTLSGFCAVGAMAQRGASDTGSLYPPTPQPVGTVRKPSISFTPRPVDPPGSQAVDLIPSSLNQTIFDPAITTVPDPTQTPSLQDVLGPIGTDLPGHPGYSGYGFIFNNKTGANLTSFVLTFDTPASISDIAVDTFLRDPDLQGFVTDEALNRIPTWNSTQSSILSGSQRTWTLTFTENPSFPWGSVEEEPPYPAFTVLSSLFPVGSQINFGYRASATAVPEPGVISLFVGSAIVGVGFLRRRRRV